MVWPLKTAVAEPEPTFDPLLHLVSSFSTCASEHAGNFEAPKTMFLSNEMTAVFVAKQPGFGDRIGLFAGVDGCRFKRVVNPGDTLRLEVTMEKLGGRFGRGRGVASVDGETACEATLSFIIPGEGVLR
jgi:hypothetical protein